MKPEPIVLSVSGVQAAVVSDFQSSSTDDVWEYLLTHPPFCMYLDEKINSADAQQQADYLKSEIKVHGDAAVFEYYCKWHAAKGYWKNETVFGELFHDSTQ